MSAPIIFSGRRAKLLTADAILNSDGSINDNNGVVNLIKNGHAEVNTTGWSTYADAAGTRPVDGTGGSPTVTWTRSTTTPLSGQAHFLFTKDASNRQGEGASYAFTVPTDLKAKVVQIELDYMVMSGTFVAGSSTADSDLIWYVYDVSSGQLIEPSSIKLLSNSSSLTDKFIANFQTSATGTSYRLICHVASTSASAYTLAFKNIKISPCQYVYGTPITDWVAYTPTLTGTTNGLAFTNSSITGKYRRVGDSAEISIYTGFTGAPGTGTGNFQWSIPSGLSIDTNKTPITSTLRLGFGQPRDGTTTFEREVYGVVYASATTVTLNGRTDAGSSIIVNPTTPFTVDANTGINLKFSVPITGWSSSVQVSDGYDGRQIAASYQASSGQSITSTAVITMMGTKLYDTTNSYNTATGVYTVPSAGKYKVTGNFVTVTSTSVPNSLNIRKNSSTIFRLTPSYVNAANNYVWTGSGTIDANAGDTIDFQILAGGAGTFYNSGADNWFTIEKSQAPTTISATATEVATYYLTSNLTINTSVTDITGLTKIVDDFGSMNPTTGVYSFSNPGKFKVSFNSRVDTGGSAASQHIINFLHNASTYVMTAASDLAASKAYNYYPSLNINAVSGDTFKVQIQSLTNSSTAIGGQNFIMIERIK